MVVTVRLIAAGSQDTSHLVPARPYLALLECIMRGDAAAGLRAIAALALCCASQGWLPCRAGSLAC